jgi:spore coat polysaccharide biosynthesis protein SpsF
MKRKLVAALACRNQGTRLYGKPLQNLDIDKGITILDYMIKSLKTYEVIDEIVLSICEGNHNKVYKDIAEKHNIKYTFGDEEDVLDRLIKSTDYVEGTDIFRLTSESPYTYFEMINHGWERHVKNDLDLTALDGVPDGSGFEIIKLDAYKKSHYSGESRHRSELCSLYIRENKDNFKIQKLSAPKSIRRTDIRLTVDLPEDLVLCRAVYQHFKSLAPLIPLEEIISFVDSRDDLKKLVDPFIEQGLKNMYL